jgi:hypothetical protein
MSNIFKNKNSFHFVGCQNLPVLEFNGLTLLLCERKPHSNTV